MVIFFFWMNIILIIGLADCEMAPIGIEDVLDRYDLPDEWW